MSIIRMLAIQLPIFLVALLVMLLPGCGESQSVTASYFGGLELKIESDRSSLKSGESVHIRFTTTNTGSRPIVIESQDTPVLDIILEEVPSRRKLTSWADQHPDKASRRVEWKPSESKMMELTWTYSGKEHIFADFEGILSENSRKVQAIGVRLCLEPCR